MADSRRNEPKILDELLERLKSAPVWAGPLLAILFFAVLRWAIPWLLRIVAGPNEARQAMIKVLTTVSVGVAPFAAGIVLFVWAFAEVQKRIDRRPDREQDPKSSKHDR